MSRTPALRALEVRHLQAARALLAALAAAMITFTPDHSAAVGLAIFSGFAITTALVLLLAAWSVYPATRRRAAVSLGVLTLVAGLTGGIVAFRSAAMYFALVITWAAVTGIIETIAGARGLHAGPAGSPARTEARDALTVGILTLLLAIVLAIVPSGYALQYYIQDAGRSFTLTGITIGVGVFGAYAAIIAVYLAIAALSPRRQVGAADPQAEVGPEPVVVPREGAS